MNTKTLTSCVLLLTLLLFTSMLTYAQEPLQSPKYKPGDYSFSLNHQGLKRTYKVHTPPDYNGISHLPIVVALHGGTGDAEGMRELTQMDLTSNQEGFIVVYPEGTGKKILGKTVGSWNAGKCCLPASRNKVDDVGFISKMLDELEKNFNFDKKRVYITGHSNGAMMTYRLACELSSRIAAIGPSGAPGVFTTCTPTRAVPTIHFHGLQDKCAPYGGGECGGGACASKYFEEVFGIKLNTSKNDQVICKPIPEYFKEWKTIQGITAQDVPTFHKNETNCTTSSQSGVEMTLCTSADAGHTWPGGSYGKPCKFPKSKKCRIFKNIVGNKPDGIDGNKLLWDFFKKYKVN